MSNSNERLTDEPTQAASAEAHEPLTEAMRRDYDDQAHGMTATAAVYLRDRLNERLAETTQPLVERYERMMQLMAIQADIHPSLWAIVRQLARGTTYYSRNNERICIYCTGRCSAREADEPEHTDYCLITRSRALLAQLPPTPADGEQVEREANT